MSFCLPKSIELPPQARRKSYHEFEGSKMKRFNAVYTKTNVQMHKKIKDREIQQKKLEREQKSKDCKYTLISTDKRRLPTLSTHQSTKSQIVLKNKHKFGSNYTQIKNFFINANFQRPQYPAQLCLIDQDKENISLVYNIRPKYLGENLRKISVHTYRGSKQFQIKSQKSFSTYITSRS
ncbi:hypothetical protein pb186bvf_017655 [Paramecium bursaria]